MLRSNQRHAEHQIHYSKQKVGELTSNTAAEPTATSQPDTDRWRGRMKRRWRDADYLKKQAASEEVGQPVTLTGDSYTDLRRDGG